MVLPFLTSIKGLFWIPYYFSKGIFSDALPVPSFKPQEVTLKPLLCFTEPIAPEWTSPLVWGWRQELE